jgi:DNA-3-methyladenine glycosylase II
VEQVTFQLRPIPPFRLDLTAWALRRRPENNIDQWDSQTYRRALIIQGSIVGVEVRQSGTANDPLLVVNVFGEQPSKWLKNAVIRIIEMILGTQIDLSEFYRLAENDQLLGPLVMEFRGVKPPRYPTLFEALVNSISCQQISLNVCIRLIDRLVERLSPSIMLGDRKLPAFPNPPHLAKIDAEQLRRLGYSYNKARAILDIVSQIQTGKLDLDRIAHMDDAEALSALMELRGVGHWTAEYTLLRGAGRTHLFPTGDSGALKNLQRWLAHDQALSPDKLKRILAAWSPYSGVVYFHLLLRKLSELGYLK